MSVLIKGMELPESCSCCAIRYEMFCPLRHRFIADEGRRKDCPLIELPPHGRLIDADALMKQIEHDTPLSDVFEKVIQRYLKNAFTIIPAEEEI